MRQRNATDQVLVVPAIPVQVDPGDEVDHPVPIAGFDLVPEPAPEPAPVEVAAEPVKPARSKRTPLDEGPPATA